MSGIIEGVLNSVDNLRMTTKHILEILKDMNEQGAKSDKRIAVLEKQVAELTSAQSARSGHRSGQAR